MIELRSVSKTFGTHHALTNIDMTVSTGSIYGLVGTNGSGKTTILNILAGVLRPDSGSVVYDGSPVYENPAVKSAMVFVPDDLSFLNGFTLKQAAKLFSGLYAGKWNDDLFSVCVTQFKLDCNMQIAHMSKGMRKQAMFCLSFARKPSYMLLDEPIDGLDPIVRRSIWELIVDAAADRGMTTVVSSHNLRELEGYCDSICAIKQGQVVVERDLDELKSDIHKLQISFGAAGQQSADIYDSLDVLDKRDSGSVDYLIVRNSAEELDDFARRTQPILFDKIPLTLEEIFMYQLGGNGNEHTSIL
ncbi:ABC transporter ATP-binding protein [Bifidobacterium sp.]|jgi:ABC-2 type transport system ATP-binding protein|uniref:ABC transporter ATP-binding protein n=1 Tax=Bifidobacterium sp. TaxID=41200 RepID=UPI0025C65F76|nr:ABC transporter ATP-binding protein [Bifidobacterium sp.]MCI1634693.1 ABC transporter ATP-binding protein [Bifidobacterium sp.]